MVSIKVNLYADLRKYANGAASVDLEVEPGRTVGDVIDQLCIPREQTRIVFVNHRAAKLGDPLQGGERVDLFSAIGGG